MTKRKKMKDEVILGSAYLAPVEYYTKLLLILRCMWSGMTTT